MDVLVFDLDNTLIDRDLAMLFCIENHYDLNLNEEQKLEIQKRDNNGYSDRIEFCNWLNSYLKLASTGQTIWETIQANIGNFVSITLETISVLKKLQQAYTLAILTNGSILNQTNKINKARLNKLFKAENIFISEAIQFSKPNYAAFQFVQEHFKEKSICMIGDHETNDILGALNFGWQAIYFNRKGLTIKGAKTITNLTELKTISFE